MELEIRMGLLTFDHVREKFQVSHALAVTFGCVGDFKCRLLDFLFGLRGEGGDIVSLPRSKA